MRVVPTVVIVEKDRDLSRYLVELLTTARYTVHPVFRGARALVLAAQIHPDVVLVDADLPDIPGETVYQQLKQGKSDQSVLLLLPRDRVHEVVSRLQLEEGEYMTKPFRNDELLARLHDRLDNPKHDPIIKVCDLELNTDTFTASRGGKEISLTKTEYSLLFTLAKNAGKVLTREMLLSSVWAYTPDLESRVVDVYMGYLRKKIDRGFDQQLLVTVRGFGYMLKSC